MLKETIVYVDYNGTERKEDFYFNLSESELLEMQMTTDGGYGEKLQAVIDSPDIPFIAKTFKEILLKAYGEKSPDGKRLVKSKEISEAFSQTEAYNQLFMKLLSSGDYAGKFFMSIIPPDLSEKVKAAELPKATN